MNHDLKALVGLKGANKKLWDLYTGEACDIVRERLFTAWSRFDDDYHEALDEEAERTGVSRVVLDIVVSEALEKVSRAEAEADDLFAKACDGARKGKEAVE